MCRKLIPICRKLLQVNFYGHGTLFAVWGGHWVYDFLSEDDIVASFLIWDETRLERIDKVVKMGLKVTDKDFRDGFVEGVT